MSIYFGLTWMIFKFISKRAVCEDGAALKNHRRLGPAPKSTKKFRATSDCFIAESFVVIYSWFGLLFDLLLIIFVVTTAA